MKQIKQLDKAILNLFDTFTETYFEGQDYEIIDRYMIGVGDYFIELNDAITMLEFNGDFDKFDKWYWEKIAYKTKESLENVLKY